MKFRRILKSSLAVALVFGTAAAVAGCGKDNDSAGVEDSKQYQIYKMELDAGATDLTYEEWLVTIKGAKGDKGEDGVTPKIEIGSNGNWYINDVDTEIKATGASGAAGADGSTWSIGTINPVDANGKNGDFYFNNQTKEIWRKENNVWVNKGSIKGNKGDPGDDGREVEFRTTATYIQWRYKGETNPEVGWTNLVELSTITGGKGDTGKDGTTWLTGVGNPEDAEGLNAKEGDFYFDKVGNNIWKYADDQWVLEVDLEDDVLPLTLKDNTEYTGNIMGRDFTITLETVESTQRVKELYISGVVNAEEQPINCKDMVISYGIENNVIILTVDISGFPGSTENTSTQYLVLDANDDTKFVTYVSEEDKELIKGTYQNNNTHLTVGTTSILYWDGDVRVRGTYQVIGHNDGVYTLNITTDAGKTLTAHIDIYSRYYNFDIEDFSGVYSSTLGDFTYDEKTGTITFEESESISAIVYEYAEDTSKAAIVFEVEENSYAVFEVDYISGTVTDESGFAGIIPFMGNAILYGEDAPERFYVLNERNKLERVYDNHTVYSNEAVTVTLNLSNLSYRISTNGNMPYTYSGSLEELFMTEPVDGVITIVDGNNIINLAFDNYMTLIDLNIIGEKLAVVNNEQTLKTAIRMGSEKISLADSIVISSPINVENDVVIEGNHNTISASSELEALIESDLSEVYTLFYIAEDVNVEFNNIELDGNQAGRAITAINGTIVFKETHVTNGVKKGVYRSGGVFIGYAASFEMHSGSIMNNNGGVDGAPDYENYYLYYSSDLWIGANAVGSVVAINGGNVGRVFVNANEYSANNPGSFTLSGGYIDSVYVEYDSGYGATFNYQESYGGQGSSVGSLYISTTTSGVAADPIYNAKYGVYHGGEFAEDVWNGDSAEVPQAVNDVINITKASQLAGLAKSVNAGNTYEGITIKLDADLNLNNIEWTPIGYGYKKNTVQTGAYFDGIFDGQGHTIYNLKVTGKMGGMESGSAGVGLFGQNQGTIKNLNIDGAEVSGNHYVAAVVGFSYYSNIINVHVANAHITCTLYNDDENGDKAGVIAGYFDGSNMTDSSATNSTVNASRDAGQLIGCWHNGVTEETFENNTATNVIVTDNDETVNSTTNDNIRNELIGRDPPNN